MVDMFVRYIKQLSLLAITLGLLAVFVPAMAYAQSSTDVCRGVGVATGGAGCSAPDGSSTVNSVIATVINILSAVVGVVAVIMIIIAGFKYVSSGGDASSISSAKQTIIYALVGLAVAAGAQAIARFVLSRAT